MDPAAIVGLVSSAVQLATLCGSAAKDLNTLVSKYNNAKLAILSMVQGLDTMQLAWSRIGKWAQNQLPDELLEEDDFMGRLRRSLETGSLVMDALNEELLIYKPLKMGLTQRTKVVWNEGTLRTHQERIRDQASSMTLLLQAIHLPTFRDRDDLLRRSEKQFEMSDESAYSIVPSRMSMSIYTGYTTGSGASKNEEELVYKPLTFENELFTARVYKRNYRTPTFQRLFKGTEQKTSDKTRPRTVAQEIAEDPNGSEAEDCTIREPGPTRWWHTKAQNAEPRISFADACEQGNVEIVETFLKSGQDVHVPVVWGNHKVLDLSAIHVAAKGGHVKAIEILLSYGADKEMLSRVSRKRPLHLAVQAGHVAMVRYLLDNGTNIAARDGESAQAIHEAAECGSTVILSFLLDRGAAIDSAKTNGDQPLHMASENPDRANVIRFLCSQGADIEAKSYFGFTPLYYACLHNALNNMEALLELGAAHSPRGRSILGPALRYGYLEAAHLLLERGIDPNRPASGGQTALHILFEAFTWLPSCPSLECVDLLKLLLEYGADPDLQDSNGNTPLHCLCSLRHLIHLEEEIQSEERCPQTQLANILSRSMRCVDAVNLAGETALCLSMQSSSCNWLSQSLIDSGARLLVNKPGIEIGLNVDNVVFNTPLFNFNYYLRQGSNTSRKRLWDYQKYGRYSIAQLESRWFGVLRRFLASAESEDLSDSSFDDGATFFLHHEATLASSMSTGEPSL